MTLTLFKILLIEVINFLLLILSLLIRWRNPLLKLNSFDGVALLVLNAEKGGKLTII